jgi:hypothetical protein
MPKYRTAPNFWSNPLLVEHAEGEEIFWAWSHFSRVWWANFLVESAFSQTLWLAA